MQKIMVCGNEVGIECNAFTPIAFSQSFYDTRDDGTRRPRDISDDLAKLIESLQYNSIPAITPLLDIFYAMARTADPKIEPFAKWITATFPPTAFDLTDGGGWAAEVLKVIEDNFFPGAKEVSSEAAEASASTAA